MLPENFIYVGVSIVVISYVFYFRNIFRGSTKPNLISWFLWMLAPMLGVFFMLKAGAGLSVLPVFTAGFGPMLVILVAIFRRNSYWKINSFDLFCGALSVVALIIYILTKNLTISIVFVMLSDGLAAVPTIIKSWKYPETETASVYFASIVSQTIALLTIKNWIFNIYSLAFYFIGMNIVIIFCIYRKKIFRKKVSI